MPSKLTLSIDKEIIARAKKYAQKRNTSLSDLIENYLVSVTSKQPSVDVEISPLVKSLSGVLNAENSADHKKNYSEYLSGKYS
jgi:macrodomain Ter protein organizer (MatP/YcbG family)